jgi:hypothetical protein
VEKDRNHAKWVAALVQALQHGTVLDLAPGEEIHLTINLELAMPLFSTSAL